MSVVGRRRWRTIEIELGSGSVRIHDPEVQAQVFEILGISADDAERRYDGDVDGHVNIADQISGRLVERLIAEDPHRTSTYRVESQLIENYKRIYYFTKRIAKTVSVTNTADNREAEPVADAL